MDATSTALLNTLYDGGARSDEAAAQIVGLFRMTILDTDSVIDHVKGRPIYLGLAMGDDRVMRMQPQDLNANLPLVAKR